jgi:hypothetical protein
MQYEKLDHEDFDAIVTGELTHYALWFEGEINNIISDYFIHRYDRLHVFKRLILYREGLTFQDKIEIVRGLIPNLGEIVEQLNLKSVLNRIEEFKAWRNSMAHGIDCSNSKEPNKIIVEVVNRSGKEKQIEITPASHRETLKQAENLLTELTEIRKKLKEVKF